MNNPLKELKLGGGVWKIKPHPSNHDLLLCACMQNGFVIANLNTQTILCHYKDHGSLAYGCDWQSNNSMNDLTELMDDCMSEDMTTEQKISTENMIASCSFYDKTVHVWKQLT
jgi:diphthamide biosynthesis protein 7